jgi:putative addiction module component (TIGR02574 family)
MSSATVRKLIALASELSDDERGVLIDAIAPGESVASLADEWVAEIESRAARVRSDPSRGKPVEEVFERLESKLKAR